MFNISNFSRKKQCYLHSFHEVIFTSAVSDVPKIKAPLMLHYASLDTRITEGWPPYEAALKANGKKFQAFIYENVNHGFHNDTTPRYDKTAAELAWKRTIDFFNGHLK